MLHSFCGTEAILGAMATLLKFLDHTQLDKDTRPVGPIWTSDQFVA